MNRSNRARDCRVMSVHGRFSVRVMVIMTALPVGTVCTTLQAQPATLDTSNVKSVDVPALVLVRTIPLAGVQGRMDHMAVDAGGKRLWLAALGNNTVEIIDLEAGRTIHSIGAIQEPQGVCLVPELNRIVVASGEDGMCRLFDGSLQVAASVGSLDDADNVRYDPQERRVYLGYGQGALAVIDPDQAVRLGDIKLAGHPESFQMEHKGRRIFVNVPAAEHVAVLDRDQRAVVATWSLPEVRANYPMALDEAQQRLFVACRKPARMVVFDTQTGQVVANLECCGDADDVFHDAPRRRVYVSGGAGCISVYVQADADHYQAAGTIATVAGARTALFVPQTSRLYLAVPQGTDHEAEVREYRVQP